MKQYGNLVRQIMLTVLVERISRFLIDQYVMPTVEKLPTKKNRPFGFQ